jgi:hypothetical protein
MPILEWSETQPRLELSNADELDHAIERLAKRYTSERPAIVALYAHGHQLILGLGLPDSFVQIRQWEGHETAPIFATAGDPTATGNVVYYFLGSQETEIPRRHLVPIATARRLAKQFLESGTRSSDVTWEEV